jgi:hypothetical protein
MANQFSFGVATLGERLRLLRAAMAVAAMCAERNQRNGRTASLI